MARASYGGTCHASISKATTVVPFSYCSAETNGAERRDNIASHQHKDLDEDPTGRSRGVLAEADGLQARPRQRIRVQEVGEEFGHVPKLVGLQPAAKDSSRAPQERRVRQKGDRCWC